jgi:predicted house-cleaning NTP pyrophosphatase (Maf/HAM1 superfamily)
VYTAPKMSNLQKMTTLATNTKIIFENCTEEELNEYLNMYQEKWILRDNKSIAFFLRKAFRL